MSTFYDIEIFSIYCQILSTTLFTFFIIVLGKFKTDTVNKHVVILKNLKNFLQKQVYGYNFNAYTFNFN